MVWRGILLVAIGFLGVPLLGGASLKLDATKKKAPNIIQPSKQKTKFANDLQNERYRTKSLPKDVVMRGGDKPFLSDRESASQSRNEMSDQRSPLVSESSRKTTEILDKTVTSSDEFERAYRRALRVELSKRAAAQVEVSKAKKRASQSDINQDAKARRSDTQGFDIQKAGSGER